MRPTLDVSEAILAPEFADTVTVNRYTQDTNSDGETILTKSQTFQNVVGVVTPSNPTEMRRGSDEAHNVQSFSFITLFRLQDSSKGLQADEILWDGLVLTVNTVVPCTRYGAGFVEAEMTTKTFIDPPPAS